MTEDTYIAYLLRLWREGADAPWRATLENPHAGERAGFGTLAELIAFLEAKTGERLQGDGVPTRPQMGEQDGHHPPGAT